MKLLQQHDSDLEYIVVYRSELPVLSASDVLHPLEYSRFETMTPDRADEFLLGRYAIKLLIQKRADKDMKELFIDVDSEGKPVIADSRNMFCSISHSGECAAAAVSSHPVGIDIERISKRHPALLRSIASEAEITSVSKGFLEEELLPVIWTCKEAATKADTHLHTPDAYCISHDGGLRIHRETKEWHLEVVRLKSYIVALAMIV